MNETREFHLGDILSVTTGRLVSPRLIDGVYDILNFMTGDDLYTHQLPRACEQSRPYLLAEHPELGAVDHSGITGENWESWLAEQVAAFGETLTVTAIPAAQRDIREPLAELAAMVPPEKIIVLEAPNPPAKDGEEGS